MARVIVTAPADADTADIFDLRARVEGRLASHRTGGA
jgi:hypothetical protein